MVLNAPPLTILPSPLASPSLQMQTPTSPVTPQGRQHRTKMNLSTVLHTAQSPNAAPLPKLSPLQTSQTGNTQLYQNHPPDTNMSLPPLSPLPLPFRSQGTASSLPSLASQSFPPTATYDSTVDSRHARQDSLIQRLRDFTASPQAPVPQHGAAGGQYAHPHVMSVTPGGVPGAQQGALPIVKLLPTTTSVDSKDVRWGSINHGAHVCRKCNTSFRRRDNLTAHIRAQHKGERPFRCDVCGFRFIKKDHAMKHWKVVHLKERPFVCNRCDSRFGQRSDLNKHVRSVHLRIKPFQCEHCGLRFSHRGNQIRHQAVVHEKKKPFSCTLCSFTFAEKSNLVKHCQAVHKMTSSSPSQMSSRRHYVVATSGVPTPARPV